MLEKIHIFHTNDLHSHFENWPRMQSYIRAQRQMLANEQETSFLMDVGDHLDRSNIYTEATLGLGNVQMLNDAEYDVVTIGNNEGITLTFEQLFHLYDAAKFEVVVGNITPQNGENPSWLKRSTILTTQHGTTIAVVGATAAFDMFYESLNWTITDPIEAIIDEVQRVRNEVDLVVCLSHLGINDDELLANRCPHIDVIFGSHTHHVFEQGKWVNGVLLTGGGKFGHYTGHLKIVYDAQEKRLVELTDELIDNNELPPVEGEQLFLYELATKAKKQLSTPMTQLHKTYYKEWFHYSPMSDLFAKALFAYTDADCAMFNGGLFLTELKKGYLSAYDMHHVLPHPINVCVIELSGAELTEMYRQGQNEEWPNLQLKGLGFRGVVFGKMLFYEMKMSKQHELMVRGEVVDPHSIYKLATLDMFTFGYFFPTFKYAKKHYLLPAFIRDIFLKYLRDKNDKT